MNRVEELQLALDAALNILIKLEPGDSRAVSDEFVAMASIAAGISNDACFEILNKVIADAQEEAEPTEVTVELGDNKLPTYCATCDRIMYYSDPKYGNYEIYAPCMWPDAFGCI